MVTRRLSAQLVRARHATMRVWRSTPLGARAKTSRKAVPLPSALFVAARASHGALRVLLCAAPTFLCSRRVALASRQSSHSETQQALDGRARSRKTFRPRQPSKSQCASGLLNPIRVVNHASRIPLARQLSCSFGCTSYACISQGAVFGPTALFLRIAEQGSHASTSHDGVNHCALSELLIVFS